MKTKTELENSIISVTTKINQKFPELTKYINEMPVNISENNQEEINTKNLNEYHNSLVELLEKYSKTHTSIGIEDEENNFYSLGGDNHTNLDEDKR
jgi:hypothetical protein